MQHEAYEVYGRNRGGDWLIMCDHASNHIHEWVGPLGVCAEDMARHIAYDIGACGLAQALGQSLNSPVVCSNFSRLVIDPNRGEDDPTLIMKLYDGTIIPANRHISPAERSKRLDRLYRPYHQACADLSEGRAILSVHSFTPRLKGRPPRPWQIGVLHSHLDQRLSCALIDLLKTKTDLCVGDNEPYSGHLPGDAIDRHALEHGRLNTLIELRNDLITTPEQQHKWADLLAPLLSKALARANRDNG